MASCSYERPCVPVGVGPGCACASSKYLNGPEVGQCAKERCITRHDTEMTMDIAHALDSIYLHNSKSRVVINYGHPDWLAGMFASVMQSLGTEYHFFACGCQDTICVSEDDTTEDISTPDPNDSTDYPNITALNSSFTDVEGSIIPVGLGHTRVIGAIIGATNIRIWDNTSIEEQAAVCDLILGTVRNPVERVTGLYNNDRSIIESLLYVFDNTEDMISYTPGASASNETIAEQANDFVPLLTDFGRQLNSAFVCGHGMSSDKDDEVTNSEENTDTTELDEVPTYIAPSTDIGTIRVELLGGHEYATPVIFDIDVPLHLVPAYRDVSVLRIQNYTLNNNVNQPFEFEVSLAQEIDERPLSVDILTSNSTFSTVGNRIYAADNIYMTGSGELDSTNSPGEYACLLQSGYSVAHTATELRIWNEYTESVIDTLASLGTPSAKPVSVYAQGKIFTYLITPTAVYEYSSNYPVQTLELVNTYALSGVKFVGYFNTTDGTVIDLIGNGYLYRLTQHDGTYTEINIGGGTPLGFGHTLNYDYVLFYATEAKRYNGYMQEEVWSIAGSIPLDGFYVNDDDTVSYYDSGTIYDLSLTDGSIVASSTVPPSELSAHTLTYQEYRYGVLLLQASGHIYNIMLDRIWISQINVDTIATHINTFYDDVIFSVDPNRTSSQKFNGFKEVAAATASELIEHAVTYTDDTISIGTNTYELLTELLFSTFVPDEDNSAEFSIDKSGMQEIPSLLNIGYTGYRNAATIYDKSFVWNNPQAKFDLSQEFVLAFTLTQTQFGEILQRYISKAMKYDKMLTFNIRAVDFDLLSSENTISYNGEIYRVDSYTIAGDASSAEVVLEDITTVSEPFVVTDDNYSYGFSGNVAQPIGLSVIPLDADNADYRMFPYNLKFYIGFAYGEITKVKIDTTVLSDKPTKLVSFGSIFSGPATPGSTAVLQHDSLIVDFDRVPDLDHCVNYTEITTPSSLLENALYVNNEWIQFLSFTFISETQVMFTNLLRGRRGTSMTDLSAGGYVFLYDPDAFIEATLDVVNIYDGRATFRGIRIISAYGQECAVVPELDYNLPWAPALYAEWSDDSIVIDTYSRLVEHLSDPLTYPTSWGTYDDSIVLTRNVYILNGDFDEELLTSALEDNINGYIVRQFSSDTAGQSFLYTRTMQITDDIFNKLNSDGNITIAAADVHVSGEYVGKFAVTNVVVYQTRI